MGRTPCCEEVGLKKGAWTPEEDHKLLAYIEQYGHGSWRALPKKAGLQRCGKSCRLRWTNYLRPDIRRGKFSLQEEQTIIQLHALLGNRWSVIATHLWKRTDNEIKNYWNTHLKKRLTKMGIDPITHKSKRHGLDLDQLKDAANLSHMAQWETARLEAEARLVRKSKLHVPNSVQTQLAYETTTTVPLPPLQPPCLDVLTDWQGSWQLKAPKHDAFSGTTFGTGKSLESLKFGPFPNASEAMIMKAKSELGIADINFPVDLKERMEMEMQLQGNAYPTDYDSLATANENIILPNFIEELGLGDIILLHNCNHSYPSITGGNASSSVAGICCGDFEQNKNYWNDILNVVNCFSSGSPVF